MHINKLDTPCVVVDKAIVEKNIQRFQDYCDQHDLLLRPHIKTHKLPWMAFKQLQAGAIGINCQKVSEAEVFVEAGIKDILITYNILGEKKLGCLVKLAKQASLTVVADNIETVDQLSAAFKHAGLSIRVLVECDTGANRCGVQTPQAALELARYIDANTATMFSGLLTYPAPGTSHEANLWLATAIELCATAGLPPEVISTGGTPSMYSAHEFTVATEYRVGTYIYNDRSLVSHGSCELADCALTVLTTVVSCPTDHRVIIDAGSKSLSSDLLGMEGYGVVREYPKAKVYALSEEHGCIDFSDCNNRPAIGETLNIIPNHACVISNLFDFVYIKDDDDDCQLLSVAARGKVW